ncbi:MAG: hypothetical protein P8I11_05335 [Bacteroidia bacterium]|nr:hypothetical protein [Bacteroidia bacterium]|tara:strand:- start:464 stop:1021 length:558 start_codon:yes stop_codon:yes gene_type:complete
MKYIVKTSGKICHYQFSNIKEIEANDIEFGEMDYHELEETFLLDKCSVENEKISIDDRIEFEIYDETNNLILEFNSSDIAQNDNDGASFCPEPQYNEEYENCLGAFEYFEGEGPIFELESEGELKIENFSYSLMILELEDGEISLMDSFYYNNKSIENIDSGISRGTHRFVKIWKQNGEAFELKK